MWVVEELNAKYQVPYQIGLSWVDSDQILLLLDGLDEVCSTYRTPCVDAINIYRQEHGLVSTVVCSRSTEYLTQTARVLLRSAVTLQPLTEHQIDDYLSSAGGQLAAIQVALHEDRVLQELATTPLMLNVLALTYQGKSAEDLPTAGTKEGWQRQLFATYIKRMLTRRGVSKHYSHEQTEHWLTLLAERMRESNETVLDPKYFRIRAEWLTGLHLRSLYRLSIGFLQVAVLVVTLPFGVVFWLSKMLFHWPTGVLGAGLIFGLIAGPIAGLAFELFSEQSGLFEKELSPGHQWEWEQVKDFTLIGLGYGALIGVQCGPLFGFSYGLFFGLPAGTSSSELLSILHAGLVGALNGLVFGLSAGLVAGLLFGLVAGLLADLSDIYLYFTLRFWLWCAGILPWNLKAFLDEAAERLLLRKVGSDYIFIHRLLLDYFAS